jgi:hypothetical protein
LEASEATVDVKDVAATSRLTVADEDMVDVRRAGRGHNKTQEKSVRDGRTVAGDAVSGTKNQRTVSLPV